MTTAWSVSIKEPNWSIGRTRLCKRALVAKNGVQKEFVSSFRSPGHVQLLLASEGLLRSRRGHTELSVYLMELAGLTPTAMICEMLDGETHRALSSLKAKRFAEERGIQYLEGKSIMKYFKGTSR